MNVAKETVFPKTTSVLEGSSARREIPIRLSLDARVKVKLAGATVFTLLKQWKSSLELRKQPRKLKSVRKKRLKESKLPGKQPNKNVAKSSKRPRPPRLLPKRKD